MCVPAVALRGAGAITRSMETRLGPAMPVFAEAALLGGLLALLPWLGLVALAVAPVVRRASIDADRCQRVSRWEERHHAAAGDAHAWSAR
jgi:hypothetical protein